MAYRVPVAVDEAPLRATLAALADHDAGTSRALSAELEPVLDGLRRSPWRDVAWCASSLTATGYPVELGFPGAGGELRAVAEVAGPEVDPRERTARALALAAPSGTGRLVERVLAAQRRTRLGYGAWIGARARPGGASGTKLYLEAPPGSVPVPPGTTLRMLGVDLRTGAVERYVSVGAMTGARLTELLAPYGLAEPAARLAAVADSCLAPSAGPALCGGPAGLSLAEAGDGRPVAALHLPAWRLGRSDAAVRSRLLATAAEHGWDMRAYERASAPLARRRSGPPRAHGVVGWVAVPGRPPVVHVGLTPSPSPLPSPPQCIGGTS